MSRRLLTAVFMVVTVAAIAPLPAAAQAQTVADGSTMSRTSWGDPDLQGIWNNATLTRLERSEGLADKEFLTEEEAARREQGAIDRNVRLAARPARRTKADPTGNVDRGVDGAPGSYNNCWLELGTTVVPTRRTSLIVDPPNGRLPTLTPDAERRISSPELAKLEDIRQGRLPADSWEQLDLGDRCIWYRGVPSFPTAYNNNYLIVQTPSYVAILQEHIHDVRFIALDNHPHADEAIRQYGGDSRGHWEGDTLVVETTNFSNRAFIRNFNLDLTEALHVVERFTRVGPDMLDYQFTVEDPNIWTRPWSGSLPMARSQGLMYEYACHEGNYGLTNILTGSRALEKASAKGP